MASLFCFAWNTLGVAIAIDVFRPFAFKDRGNLSFIAFWCGWLIGDLALHWFTLQLFINFLFYQAGAFSHPFNLLALFANIVACAALLLRFIALFRLAPLAEKQMQFALGADYEHQILPELRRRFTRESFNWRAYWNPWEVRKDPDVEMLEDVVFYEEREVCLKLSIYRSREYRENCPVLIQIHGGAWIMGSRAQGQPLMWRMARQGWVSIAIEYSFSPHSVFPQHLIDCKRAIQWIKEHGTDYGMNTDCLYVTGGSAGGHLASMVALTANEPAFQPGFEHIDTTIRGCVSFYGIYDFEAPFGVTHPYPALAELLQMVMRGTPATDPKRYQQASPVHWVSGKTPPCLLIHGEADALVPHEESLRFYKALQQANVPKLAYLQLPLLEHAFDQLPTVPTQCVLPAVERYLALLYTEYLESCAPQNSQRLDG